MIATKNPVKAHYPKQRNFFPKRSCLPSFIQPEHLNNPQNGPDVHREIQEANGRMDKVMRKTHPFFTPAISSIQRKCVQCEEEVAAPKIHRMAEDEEELAVQRKSSDAEQVDYQLEQKLRSLGSGEPLPGPARSFFEPRFGRSFKDVRLHKGAKANQTAKSIRAKAYTVGNHVAFADGEYDFNSDSGRRLMAHELTHTLQQSAGTKSVQRGSAGLFGGKVCLRAPRVEWALIGAGVWKKLEQGECTGTMEDADGVTCGGGFYRVDNGQTGDCSNPRNDDATFAPRRWTPSAAGANATSPTTEGSQAGNTPPNYAYDSAATIPCPNGIRTISVDLIKLHGSTQSPSTQLATANRVFSGCCVRFIVGAMPPQESQAVTEGWLGGDTDVDRTEGAGCGNVGGEEQVMFDNAATNHGLSSRMRVFFVASFNTSGLAYSVPPYCATGAEERYVNHAVVGNNALTDTLSHEFGHILLNSGNHSGIDNPTDTRNLMFAPGRTASDLDSTQCATIFSNA